MKKQKTKDTNNEKDKFDFSYLHAFSVIFGKCRRTERLFYR